MPRQEGSRPAAQEQGRHYARRGNHSSELGGLDEQELSPAILRMVSRGKLRLRFHDVKGCAVQLCGNPQEKHDHAEGLDHNEGQRLSIHDLGHLHGARKQDDPHEGQHRGHLVAYEHGDAAHGAEHGEPVPRGPARHEYAQGGNGGDGYYVQHSYVQVGKGGVSGEGDDCQHEYQGHDHDYGHECEGQPVGAAGYEVLFGNELHEVGDRLEQAEWPPPVGPHPVLESAKNAPLRPYINGSAQKDAVHQDEHYDEAGDEVVEPAYLLREELAYPIVDMAEEDAIVEETAGLNLAVHRSTSPMLMSMLPRETIMSASFQPTSRSLMMVRFKREGDRILQR